LFTTGEHIERMRRFVKFEASDLAAEGGASHDGASSGARMNKTDPGQLATLISQTHDELLAHWREEVRLLPIAEQLDAPTLDDHIPALLDDMPDKFHLMPDPTMIVGSGIK
jgi:hypothetical protein